MSTRRSAPRRPRVSPTLGGKTGSQVITGGPTAQRPAMRKAKPQSITSAMTNNRAASAGGAGASNRGAVTPGFKEHTGTLG